jgi:hypothetical protein
MAKPHIFAVVKIRHNGAALVTTSARKASEALTPGYRVDIWRDDRKEETIYHKDRAEMGKYIELQRRYIQAKQEAAEAKNRTRRESCGR